MKSPKALRLMFSVKVGFFSVCIIQRAKSSEIRIQKIEQSWAEFYFEPIYQIVEVYRI